MINFGILGQVTASRGAWAASLTRQQQHLLAVLVMAGGRPVDRPSLETALWDDQLRSPEGGVKRVVSELRAKLEPGCSDVGDPIPGANDAYRLVLIPAQADVLRFRARLGEGRKAAPRPQTVEPMRAALREWGADSKGLYGGRPLAGLPGHWAESRRTALRMEHREAVIHCLEWDLREQNYDNLLQECERLADEPDALHDTDFVHLWVTAAHRAGLPGRADQILRRAEASIKLHLGRPLDPRLRGLSERIRTDATPSRARATNERAGQGMFNNYDNVTVGVQTAQVSGDITIRMPATDASVEVQHEGETK